MNKIIKRLKEEKVEKNQLRIVWLCQAGFLIKTSDNKIIAVDPYLSHFGEEKMNFKRMSPIIIEPKDLDVDIYLITHNHFDHLDPVTVKEVGEKYNPKFYGPCSCLAEMKTLGVNTDNTTLMETAKKESITENISIKGVYADHGEKEPHAIGYWLVVDDINIYITGDTGFRPDMMYSVKNEAPDVFIPPINGAFGNLDYRDSVKLADYCGAKHMIPCHFWTFFQHLGNPELIDIEIEKQGVNTVVDYISPGEIYGFKKNQKSVMLKK